MKNACVAFLLLVVSLSAAAESKSLPSDTDLKAAYCIGVMNDQALLFEDIRKYPPSLPRAREVELTKFFADFDENRARLRNYLLPRLASLESSGIGSALKSGEADSRRIVSETSSCIAACQVKQDSSPLAGCSSSCNGNPNGVAKRVRACQDISWLPY